MSNNIDQENPSANGDNTEVLITELTVEVKMTTFGTHLAKYQVSSHIVD